MQKMKWFVLFSSMLALSAAYAEIPVLMSAPSSPIAQVFPSGSSTVYTYTITNNVPNETIPIRVNGIVAPTTRVTVANDCGNNLTPGVSTCQIGIQVAPTSQNLGQRINQTLSVDYQGRLPLTSSIAYRVPGLALLTAVGQVTGTSAPLLSASLDGGNTWAVETIANSPSTGIFNSSSCVGGGSDGICILVGASGTSSTVPLIALSTNGGSSWAVQALSGLPAEGVFNASACTGEGTTAVCVAAGQDLTGSSPPLLYVSQNGGNAWSKVSVVGAPTAGALNAATCTGTGATAVCMVAGIDNTSGAPFLAVSTDGGSTWAVKSISGLPSTGSFDTASCTGSGATALCVAAGQDTTGLNPPLLVESVDGGNTWSIPTISGLPFSGVYHGASCVGTGVTAICAIAGSNEDTFVALLVVSTNGGTTWAVKSITGSTSNDDLNAVSCTGTDASAICTAVGGDNEAPSSSVPLVITSTNGGATWAVVSSAGFPTHGTFLTTSCTGASATAVCSAAGANFASGSVPLLSVSTNGTSTWSSPVVTNAPVNGFYDGSAATE